MQLCPISPPRLHGTQRLYTGKGVYKSLNTRGSPGHLAVKPRGGHGKDVVVVLPHKQRGQQHRQQRVLQPAKHEQYGRALRGWKNRWTAVGGVRAVGMGM